MEGDGLSIRAVLGLLRRRIWIVIACVVLALAAAGGALLVIKPVYTASTLVIVDPIKRNLLEPESNYPSQWDDARIDAEVQLVTSGSNLYEVASNLELGKVSEFGAPKTGIREQVLQFFRLEEPAEQSESDALGRATGALYGKVYAKRRDLTNLIDIGANSEDPKLAAVIADEVARVYVQQQLQAKVASVLSAQSIIESRITEVSANVANSEKAFDEFIESNVQRISAETGRTDLSALRAEFEDATTRRTEIGTTVDQAKARLADRNWAALADALQTSTIVELNKQREELAQQLASLGDGSPSAVDLRSELNRVETRMADEASQSINGLQTEMADLQAKAADTKSKLRASVLSSDLPPDILTSLYELQQASEISRAQYQALLTRQKDLETQAYLQQADSRVVAPAEPSSTPYFPRPTLILGIAFIFGIGAGITIAFLVENFVGGITSEEQAESVLKTMVIASILKQKPAKTQGSDNGPVADTLLLAPLSRYSESIRRMRIGLDQAITRSTGVAETERSEGVCIMVTSSIPNEGKTTVALSLARAYSLSGRSTLLIDCDLRKPGIHRQLRVEPSDGLIDYLVNRKHASDIRSFVTEDPGTGTQVILGSRRSDVPTDQLVAGKTFTSLVAAARRNFDVVILDTPPVGPVVDALYMVGLCDVIAYVVKWSSTPQQQIKLALESLERAKPEKTPIRAVINQQEKVPVGMQGQFSQYYLET